MKTTTELRKLDTKKLQEELEKAQGEYFKTKFEARTGQEKATHLVGIKRKYIAKIKTVQNEKIEDKTEEPLAKAE